MSLILVSTSPRVKPVLLLAFVSIALASCSVIPPQQEHYMLRSEYYRSLEEQRRLCDAEKAVIRERITGSQSEIAREEGRRIQVENDAESLREQLAAARARLDEVTTGSERDAAMSRADLESLTMRIERLEKELESTRASLARARVDLEAERETTTVLLSDIAFARGSKALSRAERKRIEADSPALLAADFVLIVGHTDAGEGTNVYALSAARAAEVAAAVRALGVSTSRITVSGRGDADLKDNMSEAARDRAVNQRVEINLIDRTNP